MPQDELPDLGPIVFPLRIILVGLIVGVAIFAAIVVYLVNFAGNGPFAQMNGLMTWVTVGFAVIMGIMQAFIPNAMVAAARRRLAQTTELAELAGLIMAHRSKTIVGAAMCESIAFMALISYMLEGDFWLLGIASLFTLMIAVRLPTANGLAAWLEQQRDLIAANRAEQRAASVN
jgi:hypothetical protein